MKMTEKQLKAQRAIVQYLQNLIDQEFFDSDELPEYDWLIETLKDAQP